MTHAQINDGAGDRAWCGARTIKASLNVNEVTCPACRAELRKPYRRRGIKL